VISLKIELNSALFNAVPNLKLGINHYTKITVSESPQMIKGRLRLFQEQLFFELQDKAVTEFDGIKEWRSIWKSLGADPNRYRPSCEALLRRIKKQNYLDPFNLAVDLNTFFSLKNEIPVGIYDLEKINGDVTISVGTESDSYEGLNGRINKMQNILLLRDSEGSFGSPFVDSTRTSVTERTTEALHVFFLRPSLTPNEAIEMTTAYGNMFTNVSGGDVDSYVIHEGQTEITI